MSGGKGPDPGWNDPPTFSYDKATEIQANAGKRGVALNKRVAFPLSGQSRLSTGGMDPTSPPMVINISKMGAPPMGSPPVGTPPKPPMTTPPVTVSENEEETKNRMKTAMENFTTVRNLEEGDEILQRIKMMEKMWSEGKLDAVIQKKILELSEDLKNGDFNAADRVQKSLMVDHVTVCSSWMVGIRQLINLQREDLKSEST